MNWLDDKGIEYESECMLEGCLYKRPLRFDFYIPKLNMAIEYDGEQHFRPIGWYTYDIASFTSMQTRDSIKNNYCKEHGIRLLRIPYTDYDNIDNILNKQIKEDVQSH